MKKENEMTIGKELLSAVLGKNVDSFQKAGGVNNIAVCFEERKNTYSSFDACYNLDSIAFLCKEWAWRNDHQIKSYKVHQYHHFIAELTANNWFTADTEPEAVFKACQWILDKGAKI